MAGNAGKPVGSWQPKASPALQKQAAVLDKQVPHTFEKYYPTPGTGGQGGVTRTITVMTPPTTQEALATGAFPKPAAPGAVTGKMTTRSSNKKKGGKSRRRNRKQKRTTRKQRKY